MEAPFVKGVLLSFYNGGDKLGLPLKPTTELEAVNFLLISVGDPPVHVLEVDGGGRVSTAHTILHQISREIQSVGLLCNSEYNYPLAIDVNNEIRLPGNVLKIDASDVNIEIVMRGNRIYNLTNHSYNFDKTLECDIVFFLDFELLPQVVRNYIMIRAARVFQNKIVGSTINYELVLKDEMEAYNALVMEQIDHGDYNMFNNPEIIQMNRRV